MSMKTAGGTCAATLGRQSARSVVYLTLLTTLVAGQTAAGDELFDFEGQTAGNVTALNDSSGGVTVDISLEGAGFTVWSSSSHPPTWGQISFFAASVQERFIANFSGNDVFGVTIDSGDYNQDADDIFLQAYSGPDGTGVLLGNDFNGVLESEDLLNGDANEFATLSYHGVEEIGSIVFWGEGAGGNNSIFFDNLLAITTPLPEPTTIALAVMISVGAAGWRRR